MKQANQIPRMLVEPFSTEARSPKTVRIDSDLVIVGGGLAGTCAGITAARAGITVTLVQDRPVLGGNASSEVRLWALGATSHMNNNNRWAREGGVIDELLVENMYRNREGNSLIFDTILLEKVVEEPNLTLLLNTAAVHVSKRDGETIESVSAFCSQNSTQYELFAPLFCDASGDGIVAFQAGGAFRMGAEASDEFGEKFAPSEEYGYLLGHSIYFYSKDIGAPVKFVPPSYALEDITQIPRFRSFNTATDGCRLWWIEYGGRLDTVHETETIKWQLWKVVYGVWNYIKNSGEFPDAETLTLEWVGHIPGKRESRRFEGDAMMIQQDIIEQRHHYDAISFGGWSIDLHPADGVFSERPGCDQWHAKGVYQVPYRSQYSKNIRNLFIAGRIMSASHVAFGSTRVMLTLASAAQAVGMAAAHCIEHGLLPRDIAQPGRIELLQRDLQRVGQYIPQFKLEDSEDLVQTAAIRASSKLCLDALPDNGPHLPLQRPYAQMLPLQRGRVPGMTIRVDADEATTLDVQLRISSRRDNYSPDTILKKLRVDLPAGDNQAVELDFNQLIDDSRYAFVCVMANPFVRLHLSEHRVTGLLALQYRRTQLSRHDIGVESFEFWTPPRRPAGQNVAFELSQPINGFDARNIGNGLARPTSAVNAWVAEVDDPAPKLDIHWTYPQSISQITLMFDSDFDHAMETSLRGHPESVMPFTVKRYRLGDGNGRVFAEVADNHQTINQIRFDEPIETDRLRVEVLEMQGDAPAAIFALHCYA
ncbi:MAG: FAD-dependent oxidoreductase [Chloroflexi bacterium]|nr:FAD-dependent oxidoreductase [Chloroflexota bacterium]MCY3581970.1 FAD-dependent oxidoreductase [Chloroflexota bacterium]MCY3715977.1 FAD-dependent oxidoreductase [Chloroflexota bacterium]MDE2651548.1 FAD-dependent oxidoreductase [Chloroflexota bacterium]